MNGDRKVWNQVWHTKWKKKNYNGSPYPEVTHRETHKTSVCHNQRPRTKSQPWRDSRLQVHTQQKYHNFSFKQNMMYNLIYKETGRLPSHMKGKIGWSQESSKYADGVPSYHSMCVPCTGDLNLCQNTNVHNNVLFPIYLLSSCLLKQQLEI